MFGWWENVGEVKEVEDKYLQISKILYPCGQPSLDFFLPDGNSLLTANLVSLILFLFNFNSFDALMS